MQKENLSNTQADVHPDQQPQQNTHNDILPPHIVDNSQQYINQQPQQEIQPSSENRTPDLPPSASYIYTIVVLAILFYGITKDDLLLICISCVMAVALLGPSTLKMFLSFIKERNIFR